MLLKCNNIDVPESLKWLRIALEASNFQKCPWGLQRPLCPQLLRCVAYNIFSYSYALGPSINVTNYYCTTKSICSVNIVYIPNCDIVTPELLCTLCSQYHFVIVN